MSVNLASLPIFSCRDLNDLMLDFLDQRPMKVFWSGNDEPLYVDELQIDELQNDDSSKITFRPASTFLAMVSKSDCPLAVIWNHAQSVSYLFPNYRLLDKRNADNVRTIAVEIADAVEAISRELPASEIDIFCRNGSDFRWLIKKADDSDTSRSRELIHGPIFHMENLKSGRPNVKISAQCLRERKVLCVVDYRPKTRSKVVK